jgi:probable rRNA maturation factor
VSAPVDITWEVDESRRLLDDEAVQSAAHAAREYGGRPDAALSVVLVDDETLADLHGRWLDDPTPTDVLSFDLGEEGGGPAGEVVVSVDRALVVARSRGVAPERELSLYVVHGILHLCGFDDVDEDDRARMRTAETEVMRHLGYPPDERPHDLDEDASRA